MALSDLRIFQWYQKYIVKAADMTNLQAWLRGMFEGTAEGAFGAAVLKGLKVAPSSGMTVTFDEGIAVDPGGRIIVAVAGQATIATPSGNPAKSLLVLRSKLTDDTQIPQPTNPGNQVYLYKKFEYDIVVINGTPSATPVYPATLATDVILAGFVLANGQSTIAVADIDLGAVDRPRKKKHKVRVVSDDYSLTEADEIIEVDASGGDVTILLEAPGDVEGLEFSVVKTDSSANEVSVSGYTISGLSVVLDSQWQTTRFYSSGTAYRSF